MSPSEEYFLKVRNKLDDLGYLQPMSFESVMLVDKLLEDILDTKQQLQHYKNIAHQSMEACSELQVGVGPYKEDNAKLIRENNSLRQKLLKAREAIEESKVELRRDIRQLEKERALQDYLCSQHASKISHLQAELAQKSAKLLELKGTKGKTQSSVLSRRKDETKEIREQKFEKAEEKVNQLTREVTRLQCEQQQLDDIIETLKNKVNARDSEIERLTDLLSGGGRVPRPMSPGGGGGCQWLDCRLLAKHNQLCQQLEESKQKQHEAMTHAVELAERNKELMEGRRGPLSSARGDTKRCCCAENAAKIATLQDKLNERVARVDQLEQEVAELRRMNEALKADKLSLDKILEITLEDKKQMSDRINELTIIEHDLMLELDRLKRTAALHRSQLAELETRLTPSPPPPPQTQTRTRPPLAAKGPAGTSRPEVKRTAPVKKVTLRAVPAPAPKPVQPPPPRPVAKKTTARPQPQPSTSPSPSPSPPPPSADWHDQLVRERNRFEAELKEMARQQEEHCAKFHPPPCPKAKGPGGPSQAPTADPQWLLLERVQAERDYYHKEFSRLRDQLANIPDHSNNASDGASSPLQKLERLLAEREGYHKEVCRMTEAKSQQPQHDSKKVGDLEQLLAAKHDEINILHGKLADLQHRLQAATTAETSGELWKRINDKEHDIKLLSEKIRDLELQMSASNNQSGEELKRRLNLKEEEILNLRERLKQADKSQILPDHHQQSVADLWRKLNLKEDEILNLREKIRDLSRNQVSTDITQTNSELWRRLNLKEDELSRMQDKLRSTGDNSSEYLSLKRKYNQKEEENLSLREQIREYECNRCSSNNGINQVLLSRLECERDTAKADCVRLREENNALRADAQRVKDCQQEHVDQMKQDYDRCVAQWEVERRSLTSEISRLSEDLRLFRERLREAQTEASELRTRSNHHKMLVEQNERELRTTQDLLSQSEAELASALDRIGQLTDDCQRLEWEAKELRQERTCLKANLTRLDQDKDALLLKVDEKTEQLVRFDGELEARDKRIATLEAFIADLQKKLDVALDTAARVEHSGRQHSHDSDRLKTELDKMEKCRDAAARENSRLQDDLAAVSAEFKQTTRSLEASRREAEDLKVQLQGYVAEVRRVTNVMEEKETERMALLEQYRSLTAESANLETNNHSLESEANSTRRRLRDAQTKVTDLEAALAEKGALVHGYERQIKELTTQVAKLERKLESRTRAESANRELSRELETQKHCISQRMDQLADDNKQLEHEVCSLRDQLTKERKASVTLENVLASSRQETMQRARDNSQLTAQVACLQAKLRELQDKLEHGTDALRRCQSECSEYQTQVAQLRMDVAERDPDRSSCSCPLRGRCSCCVLVCSSLTSIPPPRSHPPTNDDFDKRRRGRADNTEVDCTCLRIPFPCIPSSAAFPTHSRIREPEPGETSSHNHSSGSAA